MVAESFSVHGDIMASGLLIDLNDGHPMAITAGLRAPVYSTGVTGGFYGDGDEVSYISTPGWSSGYESVYIPVETVAAYEVGTDLYPTVAYLTSVSQESGRLRLTSGSTSGRPRRQNLWSGQVWFITPASQSGNSGLLIQNSTDFTAITTNANLGSCMWVGTVNINGAWNIPVDGLVFASWNNSSAVLSRIGNTIYCTTDQNIYEETSASISVRVAIFSNTAPAAGTGLNFFNAAGQCTFSTTRKPFVIQSFFNPTTSWQGISGMVPLGTYGWAVRPATNSTSWNIVRTKGLMMSGGNVKSGFGRVVRRVSRQYFDIQSEGVTGVKLPAIPNFY